ncbi:jg6709 [Pararge aegeria aegeria]|uniref:Jg6709 protein n=1 Tax=Pararge aegeria aegeria TaxID=348720 RepID=A0A8S4SEC3_9NEOP|nr:jg6709 [Pararge aegeria aegeria]
MAVILLLMLPVLTSCASDGNIHLLEEDVAVALKTCYVNGEASDNTKRQRRTSENYDDPSPRIDAYTKQDANLYDHERRNTSSCYNQIHVLNGSNAERSDYWAGDGKERFVNTKPSPATGSYYNNQANNYTNSTRAKRNEPLLRKDDNEEVDSRGIPREAELWNKIQSSVTSQQSRTLLRDQIHACFQELQSESEDNGCYYSNKLERCLMLRFADRNINGTLSTSSYP